MGYAEQTAEAESHREIMKERDELKALLSEINRFVMPGECDSVDGMRKIHRERDELKSKLDAHWKLNEEMATSNQKLREENEQLKKIEAEYTLYIEHTNVAKEKLRERVKALRECLNECILDIQETAPDTIWTRDCVSMTVTERIQHVLAQDDLLQKQENCNTSSGYVAGDDRMTKTFPEEILERSERATPSPWHSDGDVVTQTKHITRDVWIIPKSDEDAQFIAFSRTALPEAARRLKRACKALRDLGNANRQQAFNWKTGVELADELEAPMGEK